ncbi:phosphatase PAP2 family protein [Bdellovibrio bacteriovorus]|uniref:Phosphatase PAP2 family protein n=1 Tax=Bdellovibrio bacteriovorus TaxID=959 RepID=A0A1Z3NCP6_BDEBC|nr:phosphatase PAP2 family protein [Bdellovibrio bacteriovorus]
MLDFILSLDKSLFVLVNSHWTAAWADQFFPFITDLHKTPFFKYVLVPVILALFIWRRGLKKGLIIFVFALLSVSISDGVGNWALKKTVQRPRPANTQGLDVQVRAPFGGYSFVSNHSTNMFSFASFTSAIFPPATVPLYTLATVVAYSRVYNGVHFPTDVICGALLGMIFGILFARLCKLILDRIKEEEGTVTT